jgi:N-acetylneuraminate synthase
MASIRIGRHTVGDRARCFVIAEVGVNHNGRIDFARRLIDAAARAGADAVKFQVFDPGLLTTASARRAPYQRKAGASTQQDMLRALALPPAALRSLQRHAARRRVLFLATPFDAESLRVVDSLKLPAIKLGSGEVTNLPLLRQAARTGRTILLSTGMSDLAEVARAVSELRRASATHILLFHCVSAYPTPLAAVNLRAMVTMAATLGVPVGFSDHTAGFEAAFAAVALGATMIEKHLTLDQALPGPDHRASLEPAEFTRFVAGIRRIESVLGDGRKRCAAVERPTVTFARRSLVTTRALKRGTRLTERDLIAKRPATGISPMEFDRVIGRRLQRDVPEDCVLTWPMLR